jgi:hypothetical protein
MESKDLSIAIKCDNSPESHWMSFASWYSLKKKIPRCSIFIELDRKSSFFGWANRFGVKILKETNCFLKINPTVVAIRDFDGNFDIVSSKSDIQKTFVDYKDGCGEFNLENYKNKFDAPFYNAVKRYGNQNLTVNEMAVLKLWEKCYNIFLCVGGL